MAINYWCPNREGRSQCDRCNSKGDFQLREKIENLPCSTNKSIQTKIMGETAFTGIDSVKMTSSQIKADRQKRSDEDFKKNILPTLGAAERIHHAVKKGKKK